MNCIDPAFFEFYGTSDSDYAKFFKIKLMLCKGSLCSDVKDLHKHWPYLVTITNNQVYNKDSFDPDPIVNNESVIAWHDIVTNMPTKKMQKI